MGVKEIYTTLHDFLVEWLTNSGFRDEYEGDLESALEYHGFDDVDAETLLACLPLLAEELPLVYQQAIYEYMHTASHVDSGSDFEINQGGGSPSGSQGGGHAGHGGGHAGHGGAQHPAEAAAVGSQYRDEPIDEVIRHIYNIQNVTEKHVSYIDDSGDVTTTVTSLGDVELEQVLATGKGAVAADGDVAGVNTGVSYGIVAGDDVEDAQVTNVTGDRNVTGELGDATVVTGDDNVLAEGSTVIDGDFDGNFVGGDVDADHSALNFGDGRIAQDNSVDNSVRFEDSYNTDKSINDSFKVKDSFKDQSDHSKHVEIDDSGNVDKSVDLEVEIEDSFQDNSDHSTNTDLEVDVEDAFKKHVDNDKTIEFEAKESFNSDDDLLDVNDVTFD